jgi:hypothetical protein
MGMARSHHMTDLSLGRRKAVQQGTCEWPWLHCKVAVSAMYTNLLDAGFEERTVVTA